MRVSYEHFNECRSCDYLPYCGICPGVAAIEGKEIFCRIAKEFRHTVGNVTKVTE